MKFSEVLQKMNNMKLGTKIIRDDGQIYQLMKKSGKRKFGRLGNKKGQQRFMTYTNINKNFELLEENYEEILNNLINKKEEKLEFKEMKAIVKLLLEKLLNNEEREVKENKKIEELEKITFNTFVNANNKHRFSLTIKEYDKINEIVRAVNKLIKESEVK